MLQSPNCADEMVFRVEIARPALEEAHAIVANLCLLSVAAAEHWLAAFHAVCASLREFPARGAVAVESAWVHAEVRQVVLQRYRILYVVHDERVTVVHVRHGAQLPLSPGEW